MNPLCKICNKPSKDDCERDENGEVTMDHCCGSMCAYHCHGHEPLVEEKPSPEQTERKEDAEHLIIVAKTCTDEYFVETYLADIAKAEARGRKVAVERLRKAMKEEATDAMVVDGEPELFKAFDTEAKKLLE